MEREEEGGGTGGAEPCGTEKTENDEETWPWGAKEGGKKLLFGFVLQPPQWRRR